MLLARKNKLKNSTPIVHNSRNDVQSVSTGKYVTLDEQGEEKKSLSVSVLHATFSKITPAAQTSKVARACRKSSPRRGRTIAKSNSQSAL